MNPPPRQPEASASASDTDTGTVAATWFARECSGEMTAADFAALTAWRAARPEHEREYRTLQALWAWAGRVPAARLRTLAEAPGGLTEKRAEQVDGAVATAGAGRSRRWALRGALAFALVASTAAGVWQLQGWRDAQPLAMASVDTARGERKALMLPDGTRIEANTLTRLAVTLHHDRRRVELLQGEAHFSVAADAARPFTVAAGPARMRVVGTRFVVRRDGDRVLVTVAEGQVSVSSVAPDTRMINASAAAAGALLLVAGTAVTVEPDGRITAVSNADTTAVAAWRDGRIVFDDVPLAGVLAEVARYRPLDLRLADPALGRLRLSGSFRVHDREALRQALPQVLPVTLRRLPDGSVEIVARR